MAKKNADSDRRRKIDELRKKERANERRKNVLTIVLAILAGLALVGLTLGLDRDKTKNQEIDAIGVAAAEAGCGEVENANPIPKASEHVPNPVNYEVMPPMGGPHFAQTLSAIKKFYSRDDNPPPERAVHNQEHGLVIAWYDKALPDDEVELLEQAARAIPDRFMVVPWMRDDFKDDKHFAITSWGHRRMCTKVSGEAIKAFFDEFKDHQDAPERGAST